MMTAFPRPLYLADHDRGSGKGGMAVLCDEVRA